MIYFALSLQEIGEFFSWLFSMRTWGLQGSVWAPQRLGPQQFLLSS